MALISHRVRLPPELKLEAESAAAAAGVSMSEWVRQAIAAKLERLPAALSSGPAAAVQADAGDRRLHLRVPAGEAARWETEAIEHELNLTRYVRLQMSVTPRQLNRVASAVEILGTASVEMARIGRNLNQIARSVNIMPGQTTAVQRRTLMETCRAVDTFADQITAVCGALHQKLGRRRRRLG